MRAKNARKDHNVDSHHVLGPLPSSPDALDIQNALPTVRWNWNLLEFLGSASRIDSPAR